MKRGSFKVLNLMQFCLVVFLMTLGVAQLTGIVWEYRWYFPANFQKSAFLAGREEHFCGIYEIAFYSHIVTGPCAILIGAFMIWSGQLRRLERLHRRLGWVQLILVIVLASSGLWISTHAYSGFLAMAGFTTLAILTMASMVQAVIFASQGNFVRHRLWSAVLRFLFGEHQPPGRNGRCLLRWFQPIY